MTVLTSAELDEMRLVASLLPNLTFDFKRFYDPTSQTSNRINITRILETIDAVRSFEKSANNTSEASVALQHTSEMKDSQTCEETLELYDGLPVTCNRGNHNRRVNGVKGDDEHAGYVRVDYDKVLQVRWYFETCIEEVN